MQNFLRKNRLAVIHLAFWILYFTFFFYQITIPRRGMEPDYYKALLDAISQVIFMGSLSYLNYFVFLPRFLKHRNALRYFGEFILPFAVIIACNIFIKRQIYLEDIGNGKSYFFKQRFIFLHSVYSAFIVSFVAMLRFAQDWFDLEAKRKEIENEKLVSELRFLKEQINPHFLFNTLNNLYYLAHTQSPNTKEVIAKLSQMMRYMIYEANNETVPVSKEIEYISNYIDLEKLRLEDDFPIEFSISGEYQHLKITPLIFITFLENAFKHGVESGDSKSWVKVSLVFEEKNCIYKVSNSKKNSEFGSQKSGIGLKNTVRRLNLSYHNAHNLQINEDLDSYNVTLEINLKEQ